MIDKTHCRQMMDEEDRMEEPANNTVPATQRQQHADQAPGVPSTCTQPIPAVYEQEDDELKDTQVDDDPDEKKMMLRQPTMRSNTGPRGSLCNVDGQFMECFATA